MIEMNRKIAAACAAGALALAAVAGCGSDTGGASLSWSCSVTTGGTGTGAYDFTAAITAHNPGSTPVTVDGYTVVLYDASGAEIFSGNCVLNGTVMPGQHRAELLRYAFLLTWRAQWMPDAEQRG